MSMTWRSRSTSTVSGKASGFFSVSLPDVDYRQLPEGLDRRPRSNLRCDFHECLSSRRFRPRDDDRRAAVRVLANRLFEWYRAEERHAQSPRRGLGAAVAEDLMAMAAVRSEERRVGKE